MKRILVDPTSNIRSSQRLSHACLSTYQNKVKPQKAQYNSCNFLDHIPSTWITVENLELIHALMRVLLWFSCSYQTNQPSFGMFILVELQITLLIVWPLCRRQIFQMSDLSTLMVISRITMVATGNGESGFDSGEGA